jgi:hypothetical protein
MIEIKFSGDTKHWALPIAIEYFSEIDENHPYVGIRKEHVFRFSILCIHFGIVWDTIG